MKVTKLDPNRFREDESLIDTMFADWYQDIEELIGDKELIKAYDKFDKAFDEFREALTKAGFKGYWND